MVRPRGMDRLGSLVVLCGALTLPCTAGAQTTPSWRPQLDAWCSTHGGVSACAQLTGLDAGLTDIDRDRAGLALADNVVRRIVPSLLDGGSHAALATPLRDLPAVDSRSAASVALGALLEAWVGLLPSRARPLTRGLSADTWWLGIEVLASDRVFARAVHDEGTPAGVARGQLVRAAALVDRAVFQQGSPDTLLDEAVPLGIVAGDPSVQAMVELVTALPHRTQPPATGAPDLPNRDEVNTGMDAVRPAIARCVGVMDTTVRVRFVFDRTGRVREATAEGEHAGTMIGSCVRTAALGVTLPPFQRPTMSVLYPFRVFGAHPDQAAVATAPPPPDPTPPPAQQPVPPAITDPAPLPTQPSDSDVDMALASAEDSVRACLPHARPITVTLVISGEGEVQRASAAGAGNAEVTTCVEAAVMNVHFPQFTTPTVSVTRRILTRRR